MGEGRKLTVSDIEEKIQERMELLEGELELDRAAELGLLMGWILSGEEY